MGQSRPPKERNSIPTTTERAQWVARLVSQGVVGTALADIIAPGRSRGQIWDDLREYSRTRTKS